ncbi:SDR family oxidoreductase [Streptomyces sp. NPDC127091]|uniref:SDR family oxidoreductase n=1 Tax=Streptomyces sp. NPDC127091 TaxID=3347134 RepID=UPI00365D7065
MDTVVVTGGASGIGAATCRYLTGQGYRVVVADLQRTEGERLAAELDGLFVHHDVGDPASWEALMTAAVDRFGPLHGLVAAAGVKSEYLLQGPPDPVLFHRAATVNQLGVILGVQIVGEHLREQGRGSIVNIASGAAMPPAQSPDVAYVSTKWGVRGISRVAARGGGPPRGAGDTRGGARGRPPPSPPAPPPPTTRPVWRRSTMTGCVRPLTVRAPVIRKRSSSTCSM